MANRFNYTNPNGSNSSSKDKSNQNKFNQNKSKQNKFNQNNYNNDLNQNDSSPNNLNSNNSNQSNPVPNNFDKRDSAQLAQSQNDSSQKIQSNAQSDYNQQVSQNEKVNQNVFDENNNQNNSSNNAIDDYNRYEQEQLEASKQNDNFTLKDFINDLKKNNFINQFKERVSDLKNSHQDNHDEINDSKLNAENNINNNTQQKNVQNENNQYENNKANQFKSNNRLEHTGSNNSNHNSKAKGTIIKALIISGLGISSYFGITHLMSSQTSKKGETTLVKTPTKTDSVGINLYKYPSEKGKEYPSVYKVTLVNVDLKKQRLYLMNNKTILYTMLISSGMNNTTPKGYFQIEAQQGKQNYDKQFQRGVKYWQGYDENGKYMFSSIWTNKDGSYRVPKENSLGIKPSTDNGSIQLTTPDAKYIYGLVLGTPVHIY